MFCSRLAPSGFAIISILFLCTYVPCRVDLWLLLHMIIIPGTPNEKIWPGYSELPAKQSVSFVNHPYNKIGNRFPPSMLSKQVLLIRHLTSQRTLPFTIRLLDICILTE